MLMKGLVALQIGFLVKRMGEKNALAVLMILIEFCSAFSSF